MKRIIIGIVLLGLVQCNMLLDTRTAEPPERHQTGRWQPPTSPEQVLTNMENAFLDKDADNFIRCFSDSVTDEKSFTFIPDQETYTVYPQLFSSWTITDEKRVFQEMISQVPVDSLFQLVFDKKSERDETSDSAQIEIMYTLRVHHVREGIPREAAGRARFTFFRTTQRNWVIHRWEDFREEKETTWSALKAGFP